MGAGAVDRPPQWSKHGYGLFVVDTVNTSYVNEVSATLIASNSIQGTAVVFMKAVVNPSAHRGYYGLGTSMSLRRICNVSSGHDACFVIAESIKQSLHLRLG